MINFACVWTGDRYPVEYVERLRDMIKRHAPGVKHRLLCLTDNSDRVEGVTMIDITSAGLRGWWAKMVLFDPFIRGTVPTIYFDLDTVIVDTLRPLIDLETRFAVCANFTKRSGKINYPCGYGSCVMKLAPGFGGDIWRSFDAQRNIMMNEAGVYGDQYVIERLSPNADLLQDVLPTGYFVGRREFDDEVPEGASIMIFAGKTKPHNTNHPWIKEHWR